MPMKEEKKSEKAEAALPTEAGHYVYVDGELNSGPYASEDDAQAFIDGQLDGNGTIRAIEAND